MDEESKLGQTVNRISRVILAYSLWLASGALSLWALMWVRVFLLVDLPMVVFRVNPWVLRAIDRFGSVGLGIVWLIFAVASESYFRRLLEWQLSIIDVAKVFLIEALILGVAYGGHLLIS